MGFANHTQANTRLNKAWLDTCGWFLVQSGWFARFAWSLEILAGHRERCELRSRTTKGIVHYFRKRSEKQDGMYVAIALHSSSSALLECREIILLEASENWDG